MIVAIVLGYVLAFLGFSFWLAVLVGSSVSLKRMPTPARNVGWISLLILIVTIYLTFSGAGE